jgi:predicted thioesterase
MSAIELRPGLSGEAHAAATPETSAAALGSGDVPVYATPAMIALMEQAAVNALAGALPAEKTSVGVQVQVRHLTATPIGMAVRAEARLTSVEGRRLTFRVVAFDAREQIGEGVHERAVVERDKFLQRTAAKGTQGA